MFGTIVFNWTNQYYTFSTFGRIGLLGNSLPNKQVLKKHTWLLKGRICDYITEDTIKALGCSVL